MVIIQRVSLHRHCLLSICLWLALLRPAWADEVWILVDTAKATLSVMEGETPRHTFEDIAIGRYGKSYFKLQGDNRTPLGRFTISFTLPRTRYHRFLGLSYPDLERANRALVEGEITESQWQTIRRASQAGKTPQQNTPLGGLIGIHGVGKGDPEVHQGYNWTNGCIALTNEQMDQLSKMVQIGTPVEVR